MFSEIYDSLFFFCEMRCNANPKKKESFLPTDRKKIAETVHERLFPETVKVHETQRISGDSKK